MSEGEVEMMIRVLAWLGLAWGRFVEVSWVGVWSLEFGVWMKIRERRGGRGKEN